MADVVWYRQVATYFNNAIENDYLADKELRKALEVIVDIRSSDALGTEISTKLFKWVYRAWRNSIEYYQTEIHMAVAVKQINNFVIKNYNSNLDEFVNNLDWECVPYYWGYISEFSGVDIENWNICPLES